MNERFRAEDLVEAAAQVLTRAGLEEAIAQVVAEILVEADLLGYDTHGLQFLPAYLGGVESGRTRGTGLPEVLRDGGNTLLLDGGFLPGQWVMVQALQMALERVGEFGAVSVSIRRAQNISCLATYARRAALSGMLALVMASAPASAAVAPHGGSAPRLSTNPLAVGIPSEGAPLLIDTSTAATSNRNLERHERAGTTLPHPVLVTHDGRPSQDPAVVRGDPPGAILPAGGLADGHRGYAFSLMVEAFTSALCGWGRAKGAQAGGNNVFLQVMDPAAFGGAADFAAETAHLAAYCRDTPAQRPEAPVRVPGERAARAWEDGMARGVPLHPEIMPRLLPCLEKYGVAAPRPV